MEKLLLGRRYLRWLKEGKGQGRGMAYKPWLKVRDVPSIGRSTRTSGWKTDREHHFLSDLEYKFFLMQEWSSKVTDIREQYPLLPLSETVEIANILGYQHPWDKRSKRYAVMTTDFLLSYGDKDEAKTCKYMKDLEDERVIQKFQIEKIYWERRDVDWKMATENDIDEVLIANLNIIHSAYWLDGYVFNLSADDIECMSLLANKKLARGWTPMQIASDIEKLFDLAEGNGLIIFQHLITRKKIAVDITKPLVFNKRWDVE